MSIQGLNLSVNGMMVSQSGLRITNNNIANANTDNYTRKLINQDNQVVQDFTGLKGIPTSVTVETIARAKDQFLEVQYGNNITQLGFFKRVAVVADQITQILGTPSDQVINERLKTFFSAANDLSSDPTNSTFKRSFIDASSGLANSINIVDTSFKKISEGVNSPIKGELRQTVDILNQKLIKLSASQKQINILRANDIDVTSLEDQRDVLIRELREISDFDFKTNLRGDLYEVRMPTFLSPNEEAKIEGTVFFNDPDTPIIPAITNGNRELSLSINDGNANITNFTVNLPENATPREAVESINLHFRAFGGLGSVASINNEGLVTLETRLVENHAINSTTSVSILGPSPAAASLGLPAAPTTSNGKNPLNIVLMDTTGLKYPVDIDFGNDDIQDGVHATQLFLKDSNGVKYGTIDIRRGDLGAQLFTLEKAVPDARRELSTFAVNLKNTINNLLNVGTTINNTPGRDLFIGNSAGNFAVNPAIVSDPSQLAVGEVKDAGGIAVSENTIISKVAELYNGNSALLNHKRETDKLFIKSSDPNTKFSVLPINPATIYQIKVKGIANDGANTYNAGTNGLGLNSLVQVQFYDESYNPIGAANNLNGPGLPSTESNWNGTPPAGAAFIGINMNGGAFGDNDLTNNYGHFEVEIIPNSSVTDTNRSLQVAYSELVSRLNENQFNANISASTYEGIIDAIVLQRRTFEEVSLEEEAANLIRYQKAFSANARAFNAIDQSIQDIFTFI
ncbi:MAG: hypothetical protein HRT47_04760 [Candidatus Caenarcaniphilales bacterium]|nr:hypothetical protein [Candidatus Caenarcaniphilales bacterium]